MGKFSVQIGRSGESAQIGRKRSNRETPDEIGRLDRPEYYERVWQPWDLWKSRVIGDFTFSKLGIS